jgi:hypothetical protein
MNNYFLPMVLAFAGQAGGYRQVATTELFGPNHEIH